jgi:ubiquinone/menaquinone biosynthesis C-methylase UbiE
MPDHKAVYEASAVQYERLVSREDFEGNIIPSLCQITPLAGQDVVEFGAGTGRLTCLLAPLVRHIEAFDASPHMLEVARARLEQDQLSNWSTQVADHRSVPAADSSADLAISGWSICYLLDWSGGVWENEVEKALAEMKRVLRPGGTLVLLETLGTGFEKPHPPANLLDYFRLLERAGFSSTWFRTDYRFASLAEAVELVQFFFGDALADQVRAADSLILPECTGLWWLRK